MKTYSQFELWYGRDEAPPQSHLVQAGPVSGRLTGCDLRAMRVDGVEFARRIYVAVRDHNWLTIPGRRTNFKLETGKIRFQADFDMHHRCGAIDFQWRGQIQGESDGTLTYSMAGKAASDFSYNRIGFCVLHPVETSAGRPYRGLAQAGPIRGALPTLVAPQRFESGVFIPLFPCVKQLTMDLRGGVTARFEFEGDWFEMEDQRNWTDNSFKTYCTPLALSFPKAARAGQQIAQKVTVVLECRPKRARRLRQELVLSIGRGSGRKLPALGLGLASHGKALSAGEVVRLQRLRLSHLRADLHLSDASSARKVLRQAAAAGWQLGCKLELALFVTGNAPRELERLRNWLKPAPPIARLLVFHEQEPCTADACWVELVREQLGSVVRTAEFAAGTNAYFAELNRTRPKGAVLDGLVYSINPQVHTADELSLMENLPAQAASVQTARAFAPGLRVVVSPVTLKPRYNANATAPEAGRGPEALPTSVDPRQMSLFAAAWTVGSLKYLAESGADAVTYYETTGWQGLMETRAGSPLPQLFPSAPGQLFPVYHVFAALARWKICELSACVSNEPLRVIGLAFRKPGAWHLLAANLTPERQRVRLESDSMRNLVCRTLDADTAASATQDPAYFAHSAPHRLNQPVLELLCTPSRQSTVADKARRDGDHVGATTIRTAPEAE